MPSSTKTVPIVQLMLFMAAAYGLFPIQIIKAKSFYINGINPSLVWLAAFALNCIFVSLPGRFDNSQVTPEGGPWQSLFAPAPWAFAIWGVIYLTEAISSIAVPIVFSVYNQFKIIPTIAPYWVAANLYQCLWCLSFRPKFEKCLWFPASLLLGGALSLLGAVRILSNEIVSDIASGKSVMQSLPLILLRIPLSTHAGWLSAATLLNINGWITYSKAPMPVQIALVFGSIFAAFTAGVVISYQFSDPMYILTIAWAMAALAYQTKRSKVDVPPVVIQSIVFTEEILYKALLGLGLIAPFAKQLF